MNTEFKFRVLTYGDWKDITDDIFLVDEEGLRLKQKIKKGIYTSNSLDSGIEDCQWHRIVLDADISENSSIKVSFHTAGRELKNRDQLKDKDWSKSITFNGTKDALVQAPPGRHITLKIEFVRGCNKDDGPEKNQFYFNEGPILKQVKIYYPRLSYLRYLPSVYQENSQSKEFLERFLSIFESTLYDSEETIAQIPSYFDPLAAPDEFVPWLANWISFELLGLLEEINASADVEQQIIRDKLRDKNRRFILSAIELYKNKGTVSGLAALISVLTGLNIEKCCIKEYMNNVFRSYGIDQNGEMKTAKSDTQRYASFSRKMSRTVDTSKDALLEKMGKYYDEVHYVTDTSETGRYSRTVIGLYIFISPKEEFLIDEINKDKLQKIIRTFLPVFVRGEINIVVDEEIYDEDYKTYAIMEECAAHVYGRIEEKFKVIRGEFTDNVVGWTWFFTNNSKFRSNDLRFRTPHSKMGVEIAI